MLAFTHACQQLHRSNRWRSVKKMIHLFKLWIAQQWIKSSLGFSVQRYVLQRFVSKKKKEKKKALVYILTSQRKNKVCLEWWARRSNFYSGKFDMTARWNKIFCQLLKTKNSDVEVNNKYKETKEICPSESKYVHHQGWELRHGNLWWQASQRILRPYCFIYKAPKVFLLVSEYRIRRDTLNCWEE